MIGVTDWKEPGAVAQIASGFYSWLDLPDLISGDPDQATIGAYVGAVTHSMRVMRLLKDGTLSGTDKGLPTTSIDYTSPDSWGGSADLWGNTLTEADVEDVDFGFALEYGNQMTGASVSYRINATNFGFALPAGSVITGVETRVTYAGFAGGGGTTGIALYKLEMRVHYTFNPKVEAIGSAQAFVYSQAAAADRPEPDKKYRFLVYDKARQFIGEYTPNVQNEPTFKQAINTLHSNMGLVLAQNEQSTASALTDLYTEGDEVITTESDESILADLAAAIGLGEGSAVEVNNEVDVVAYYGNYEELLTESGEVLLTESDELIMVENGYPNGKTIFTGYESMWELSYGDGENIALNLLSHSKELDNIMLETDDVVAMTHGVESNTSGGIGIAGGGPTDLIRLAQVFRYTGTTGARGRLRLKGWPGWGSDIPISISIHQGTNLTTPGTQIASVEGIIPADPDNFRADTYIDLVFEATTFTNGSDYTIFIDCDVSKTGGNPTYPANFYYSGTAVANGSLYYIGTIDIPSWTDSGKDLWFELYTLGGNTTRTFNSLDPGTILRQICDFAAVRGARVTYDADSIELTGTTVSITMKTNTVAEAIAAVLKTAPADWYYYYDYGENKLHFHPRPTQVSHYYTRGRDVVKLKLRRTIEKLVNDVYFSGGGTPALLTRTTDQTLINSWRRGLAKESDNRVTVQSTAGILAQALIDQYGQPLYSGELLVLRVDDFRIEDVEPGELSGFIAFDDMVDALALQNVGMTYYPDRLEIVLDMMTPAVTKRIEDIKRNLALLEHANDPTSPTIT